MPDNEKIPSRLSNSRDHMANERTFLAWVRTALGIIVFGVVVERLAFMGSQQVPPSQGFSHFVGLLLVTFGMLITVVAFIRFRTIEKEIDEGTYKPHLLLTAALPFFMLALGVILIWIVLT